MGKEKPILLVDFDGVIHSYTSGWKGAREIPDPPVPGALEFLVRATEHFQVCIYSSRSRQIGGKGAMKVWLWKHYRKISGIDWKDKRYAPDVHVGEIPEWWWRWVTNQIGEEPWHDAVAHAIGRLVMKEIGFPTKKPAAFMTIDDRAFCFEGVFPEPVELLKFKPWNRRG